MAGLAYGQSNAQGLPPVDLPTFDNGQQIQQPPLRIQMGNVAQAQPQDAMGGWAPFTPGPAAPAQQQAPLAPPGADAQQAMPADIPNGGWAAFQPKDQTPPAEIGAGEAALRGAASGLSFGFYPAMAGAVAGANSALQGGDFSTAYDQTRQQEESAQQEAEKQHPYVSTAAQIAGGIPSMFLPGVGITKAAQVGASAVPRILQAIRGGAVAGGLYGAGDQTSQGSSPLDVGLGAAGGAVAGGALGGVMGSALEGGSMLANRVRGIVRGSRDPDLEAQRLVIGALQQDKNKIAKIAADVPALNAGSQAGLDFRVADFGGATTHGLLRTASNLAPEARDIIGDTVGPRFEQQGERIGAFIRSHFGGLENDIGQDAIKAEARRQNGPLYKAAYAAGSDGMWSPELERLSSSPAVLSAVQGAVERGGNRAVAEGMGGFNPHVTFNNGILKVSKGGGVPSHPDMQFWDYVQRELRDASKVARRAGRDEEADAIGTLHRQLLSELDKLNPYFANARGVAAAFFKASDALQAGANFLTDNTISVKKAAQVIAKMRPAERELFKRGFASALADKVEKTGFNRDVLNSIFLNNKTAKQKLLIALGNEDAGRLESLLRVEAITDRTRKALGNSTTIQQGHDAGKFAGALAAWEGFKELGLNPIYLIAAPLIFAGRQSAKKVDERVFTKVAELLTSNDPALLSRGVNIAAKDPVIRTALRYASDLSARQLVAILGPSGVGAGAMTALEHFKSSEHEAPHPNHYDQYENQGQQVAPN